ncbi:Ig-like domain-containing protein [uncultured Draconibacterium sp.]|uniref:Ig-like domain-containing protein n=1 Tax=uncultured Draconibacterium sp. TaxID=1573823 RepID=UPI002AA71B80|nr:Ig-like domain-containing protein [uncultured Draconibacterium sp.]
MKFVSSILFLLFVSSITFSQTLYLDDNVPSESSDEYFDAIFEISINMSTMYGTLYLDVSEKGGVQSMQIISDYDFDNSEAYPPGTDIHYKNGGDNTISSDYWLASAWNEGYDGYETLKMKVRVYPNQSGDIYLYFRATYINGDTEIRKPTSGYTDQQGWYCYRSKTVNSPTQLTNLKIKSIEVNNGDPIYVDESVKIEVTIEETNDVDAGEADVYYLVNDQDIEDPTDVTDYIYGLGEVSEYERHVFTKVGSNKVTVLIDKDNEIPETEDYDDNTKTIYVNVLDNNKAPTIDITSGPTDGSTISDGTVTFKWSASDSDGTVQGYEYKIDGVGYSYGSTTLTHTFSSGEHTFEVRCFDDDNTYSDWDKVSFTVNNAPTIEITSGPTDGSSINDGTVTFKWSASDSDGTVQGYEYKIDGVGYSYGSTTLTKTFSPGEHTFEVRCFDNGNSYSDWAKVTFTVTDAPVIEITSGPDDGSTINDGQVTFKWSASDSDGTVQGYEYKIDGVGYSYGSTTLTKTFSPGQHTFEVRCIDNDGNYSDWVKVTFTVNDAPTIAITSGPEDGSSINDGTVTFKWSASDSDGTIQGYEYKIDGVGYSYGSTTLTKTFSPGEHTFEVRCFDNGNSYSDWAKVIFTVTDAPVIEITSGPDDGSTINSGEVTFEWSASDSDGTVEGYEYKIDGVGYSYGSTTLTKTFSPGQHTFEVRCIDNDGNYSDWVKVTFTVNDAPTIAITSGPEDGTIVTESMVTFEWSASDSDGTIQGYEYKIDGTGSSSSETSLSILFGTGIHSFEVRCIDNDGNYSDWAKVTFTVNEAPIIEITSGPVDGSTINDGEITFEWSASDSDGTIQGYEYRIDGIGYSYGSTTLTQTFTSGEHTFEVRCYDDLNTYSDWAEVIFTVNETPTIEITSGPENGVIINNRTVSFAWSAYDSNGNIQGYEYRIDGVGHSFGGTELSILFDPGEHTFEVRCIDNDDQYSNWEKRTFRINSFPTIELTSGPEDGTVLKERTVTFTWSAFDSDGTIQNYEYRIDGVGYSYLGNSLTETFSSGEHTFEVRCIDNHGAYSEWEKIRFKVNKAPSIELISGPENGSTVKNQFVTFEWLGNDEDGIVQGYQYKIDGQGFSYGGSSLTEPFNPGEHTFEVRCFDDSGEFSEWIKITFKIVVEYEYAGQIEFETDQEPFNKDRTFVKSRSYLYYRLNINATVPSPNKIFAFYLDETPKIKVTGEYLEDGIMGFCIDLTKIQNEFSFEFSVPDTLKSDGRFYKVISKPNPIVLNAKNTEETVQDISIFAAGNAGVNLIAGGVGAGPSVAAAKVSVNGTAGMGITFRHNSLGDQYIYRKFEAGVGASVESPAINAVVGDIQAGAEASSMIKGSIGQTMFFPSTMNSELKNKAKAAYILETLTIGGVDLSPFASVVFKALKKSMLNSNPDLNEIYKDLIYSNQFGLGIEGEATIGFSVASGENTDQIKLDLLKAGGSFALGGEFVDYDNGERTFELNYAKGFDISSLNFDIGNVSLGHVYNFSNGNNFSLSADYSPDEGLKSFNLSYSTTPSGLLLLYSYSHSHCYDFEIPKNIIEQNWNSSNAIGAVTSLLSPIIPAKNLPIGINYFTESINDLFLYNPNDLFDVDQHILLNKYQTSLLGLELDPKIELDAALGFGGGLSLGFYISVLDEMKYPIEDYCISEDKLLPLNEYNTVNDNDRLFALKEEIQVLYGEVVNSIKDELQSLVSATEQIVENGIEYFVEFADGASTIQGVVRNGGWKWITRVLDPTAITLQKSAFKEPKIITAYSSRRIIRNENKSGKIDNVDSGSIMYVVSENINVSLVNQSNEVLETFDPAQLSITIDNVKLSELGLTEEEKKLAKMYFYNVDQLAWVELDSRLSENNDTVFSVVHTSGSYAVGIEFNSSDDNIAPDIENYYPQNNDTVSNKTLFWAELNELQSGVGIDFSKTVLKIDGVVTDATWNPVTNIFSYFTQDSLCPGMHDFEVIAYDYNGNKSSIFSTFIVDIETSNKLLSYQEEMAFNCYPVPMRDHLTIDINTTITSEIYIDIFDQSGNKVTNSFICQPVNGQVKVNWNRIGNNYQILPAGIYFVRVRQGERNLVKKIILE